jgi:hypothetical protein
MNCARCNLHLESAVKCIIHRRVQYSVKIFHLDAIRVNNNELSNAEPGELFDQGAACARIPDYCNSKLLKLLRRASPKSLSVSLRELRRCLYGPYFSGLTPEVKLIASDRNAGQFGELASHIDATTEHAPIR